ncbi:MAG: YncE family protein [Ardenticatenaceae bacterium]|nr:YncE family protein [Anaerolineales bacterium]MCB8976446.1 YncE family protein [Ardenticatenaceae bacterium]
MRTNESKARRFYLLALLILLSFTVITVSVGQRPSVAAAPLIEETGSTSTTYLPLVFKSIAPVPQFVKNVALPNAQCPNAVGFNAVSGYVYVANNFSYNVSAFKNGNFVTNIAMGEWPTQIAADNDSPLTYVTVLHDQVTVLNGTTIVGKIPDKYEPYGAVVNPVNGYTYITDLDSTVQVVNGLTLLSNVSVTDPQGTPPNNGAGWLEPAVVDPNTGLVYVASWSHGKMYVLDGTNVVGNYRAGWGVKDMVIDATRGYIYLAHSDPNTTYPHNISVFNLNTKTFTYIDTDSGSLSGSRSVALDPISGNAYFTNPDKNTVTVVKGTQVLKTIAVGTMPWGIGVNPNTGYVFVTNRSSNTISVIRELAVVNTIPAQGLQPFAVGVDTINDDVYIANRGDEYGLYQCRQASVTILH